MDLSQFDDAQGGSGRSVPTTPSSRTPPTITVVSASPPRPSPSATPADMAQTPEGGEQAGDGSGEGPGVEGDEGEVELAAGGDVARDQTKAHTGEEPSL